MLKRPRTDNIRLSTNKACNEPLLVKQRGFNLLYFKEIMDYQDKKLKEIISPVEIKQIVERLAREIARDYRDSHPVLVCALKSAVVFLADLIRELDIDFDIDFIQPSSYSNGSEASKNIAIKREITTNVTGRDVILVEDIIDRGKSAHAVTEHLSKNSPASIKVATLLYRESINEDPYWPQYIGTRISEGFVVGYGMDYNESYRGLKGIYILEEE